MFSNIPRRSFFQYSSALSLMSLGSFAQATENLKQKHSLMRDETGTVVVVENTFPYEKTALIPPKYQFENVLLNARKSAVFFVQHASQDPSEFVLFLDVQNQKPVYKILKINDADSVDAMSLDTAVQIDAHTTTDDGMPLVAEDDTFLGVMAHGRNCLLFFRQKDSHGVKCVTWQPRQGFFVNFVEYLNLADDTTFTLLPLGLFGDKELCFVIMDHTTRSHRFVEIQTDQEGSLWANSLCEIYEGQSLGNDWSFQYSTIHPYYNYWKPQNVDRYAFVFNTNNTQSQPYFVCHRPNGTLGAFRFVADGEDWVPQVLGVSENTYDFKDFYFYGKLLDSSSGAEVILVKNMKEKTLSVLSFDGKKWTESAVDQGTHSAEFRYEFDRYFGEESMDDNPVILTPRNAEQHESGVALSLVSGFHDADELRAFPFHISKTDDGYEVVSRSDDFLMARKKPSVTVVSLIDNSSGGHAHSGEISEDEEEELDPIWYVILSVVGIFGLLFLGGHRCLCEGAQGAGPNQVNPPKGSDVSVPSSTVVLSSPKISSSGDLKDMFDKHVKVHIDRRIQKVNQLEVRTIRIHECLNLGKQLGISDHLCLMTAVHQDFLSPQEFTTTYCNIAEAWETKLKYIQSVESGIIDTTNPAHPNIKRYNFNQNTVLGVPLYTQSPEGAMVRRPGALFDHIARLSEKIKPGERSDSSNERLAALMLTHNVEFYTEHMEAELRKANKLPTPAEFQAWRQANAQNVGTQMRQVVRMINLCAADNYVTPSDFTGGFMHSDRFTELAQKHFFEALEGRLFPV